MPPSNHLNSGVPSLDKVLSTLRALAEKPLSEATAMPREVYLSDELLELEKKNIFEKEWLCAGRTDDIPNAGDYLTYDIGDQPIIVIRNKNGSIRSMSNVCLHRMMKLLEGRGNARRITCPYHAWTYKPDGQLLAAPHMEKTSCFELKKMKLPKVRCEIWHGWIYVTLNPKAVSVGDQLKKLDKVVGRYRMEDYVGIISEDVEWNTNWKLLCENFMEGYHLPVAHRATVGGFIPLDDTKFDARGPFDSFTYQYFGKSADAPVGTAHPKNKHLKGKHRYTSILPTVFPSHMYALAPDHFWYLSIQPNGTDKVRIRFGASVAPEVLEHHLDPEGFLRDTKWFLSTVQEEDRVVVEGIFKGAKAPLSKSGPLSWLEHENHEFTQYLARRLTSAKT
ncbi:MAG: Rieske 2Fe-2S domain-containing protein [Rhodospirillales bacterium]|jgi:choline monooxygenase|nr:Rieske 2Fe-2S domain-containing protein [Rhodospirillales bacterium]MBT4040186.1 Rieske 2Fe-2S domain-containing protein [Rhodospirillales bacterium]MBT4628554.1 Rieske 2Fe-2S domain-containing protein [Rhodospirillales bacterium]MBT5352682.1 Rieske 2Fe-2S domain-containing protein [Rhodospirillales bacterium]MBT5519928.1 Rieske 2Fe-2S domain-containing protein [Rhodospirillales bacterium]